MSLLKYAEKYAPHIKDFINANKGALAATAAVPAAAIAAHEAKPAWDEFMTDQALKSVGRNAKRSALDALQFAEKHPLLVSGSLGAAGMAGAAMGPENFGSIWDTFSPVKVSHIRKRKQL